MSKKQLNRKLPPANARYFDGNICLTDEWITDGALLVMPSALSRDMLERYKKKGEYRRIKPESCAKLWEDKAVKSFKLDAEMLGSHPRWNNRWLTDMPCLVLRSPHGLCLADASIFSFVLATTKADSFRIFKENGEKEPITFYRDKAPVALLMPMFGTMDGNYDVSGEPVSIAEATGKEEVA